MSEQAGKQQQTVADALAQRVEARQGTGSPWAEALRELGAVDQAVYQAVARTPTPRLTALSAGSPPPLTTHACGLALPPRSP